MRRLNQTLFEVPWASVPHASAKAATIMGPRTLQPGLRLPADLSGEALIRAMQRTPASEYLLVEPDGSTFGVLVTEDVDRAFAAAM